MKLTKKQKKLCEDMGKDIANLLWEKYGEVLIKIAEKDEKVKSK